LADRERAVNVKLHLSGGSVLAAKVPYEEDLRIPAEEIETFYQGPDR